MKVLWLPAAAFILFGLFLGAQEFNFGAIEVSSRHSDAAVYIEGFLAGRTPVVVQCLSPGSLDRLVVKKDSYQDLVNDIPVSAGGITKVSADLIADHGPGGPLCGRRTTGSPS